MGSKTIFILDHLITLKNIQEGDYFLVLMSLKVYQLLERLIGRL